MRKTFLIFICLVFLAPVVVMAGVLDKYDFTIDGLYCFELTDGKGKAEFCHLLPLDHKEAKQIYDEIKELYDENPNYYNDKQWIQKR